MPALILSAFAWRQYGIGEIHGFRLLTYEQNARHLTLPLCGFSALLPNSLAPSPYTMLFHQIHSVSAWVLLGLIGLHILAALFHRFVLRDEVLQSMLPWRASSTAGPAPKSLLATYDAAAR